MTQINEKCCSAKSEHVGPAFVPLRLLLLLRRIEAVPQGRAEQTDAFLVAFIGANAEPAMFESAKRSIPKLSTIDGWPRGCRILLFAEGVGNLIEAKEARRCILSRSTCEGQREGCGVRTLDHKARSAIMFSNKGDAPWPQRAPETERFSNQTIFQCTLRKRKSSKPTAKT
jgi:hypothetical protein